MNLFKVGFDFVTENRGTVDSDSIYVYMGDKDKAIAAATSVAEHVCTGDAMVQLGETPRAVMRFVQEMEEGCMLLMVGAECAPVKQRNLVTLVGDGGVGIN